jgi:adenylate cyclase
MLVSCYHAIGDEAQMRNAARMTSERVERAVAHDPTNGSAMAGGAFALAMGGDMDRAREWMRRALLLDPDNLLMRYNIACTIVQRLGDSDEALSALEPFFRTVTSTTWIWHAEADPDLDSIREDSRFKLLLAAAKERLGMTEAA